MGQAGHRVTLVDKASRVVGMNILELSADAVARLTRAEREQRVRDLVAYSNFVLDRAIESHITNDRRKVAAVAVLYSGGNDSTVLAHLFRNRATVAIHANTGIGIEQTRQFVRDTCEQWGLRLIEKHPPTGSTYRELVIDQGFPGPGHHWKMYQRLKERCLRQARKELVDNPRTERVVFLAGRRRTESARRADIVEMEREGSTVWVSPLALWTALDMSTYRLMRGDVPVNEVSELIHMSGECLCGSFAHDGELDEIGFWFPGVKAEIEELENAVACAGRVPAWKARWGWGADKQQIEQLTREGMSPDDVAALFTRSTSGPLCTSCDARSLGGEAVAL